MVEKSEEKTCSQAVAGRRRDASVNKRCVCNRSARNVQKRRGGNLNR